jgi:acyl-CoA-binding protein
LLAYSLYKQATEGDFRPKALPQASMWSAINPVAIYNNTVERYKAKEWKKWKGMKELDAKREYCKLVVGVAKKIDPGLLDADLQQKRLDFLAQFEQPAETDEPKQVAQHETGETAIPVQDNEPQSSTPPSAVAASSGTNGRMNGHMNGRMNGYSSQFRDGDADSSSSSPDQKVNGRRWQDGKTRQHQQQNRSAESPSRRAPLDHPSVHVLHPTSPSANADLMNGVNHDSDVGDSKHNTSNLQQFKSVQQSNQQKLRALEDRLRNLVSRSAAASTAGPNSLDQIRPFREELTTLLSLLEQRIQKREAAFKDAEVRWGAQIEQVESLQRQLMQRLKSHKLDGRGSSSSSAVHTVYNVFKVAVPVGVSGFLMYRYARSRGWI